MTKKKRPPKPIVYCTPIPVCPPVRVPLFKRIWRILIKGWQFIIFLTVISALFVLRDQIHDLITPREKLWKEKVYLNGIRIPNSVFEENQPIFLFFGQNATSNFGLGTGRQYSIEQLEDTIDLSQEKTPLVIMPGGGGPFGLKLLLKGRRLYVGETFKDIDDKYVGRMNFTEWELKSSKISNYHDGDDNMEIIDDNGYVLFNMRYQYPNIIIINGYFVGDNSVQVANDKSFAGFNRALPDYKQQAIEQIRKITPLNNY